MRGFFEELRYRNVFRVGVAYAVVGWLTAQVTELVVGAFELPAAFLQMVIILLLVGFPVSLFLAWAFELTPDGVKKASELPEDAPKDPRAGKRLNAVIMATLVIAVAWLGWDKLQRPAPEELTTDTPVAITDKSIAVLPFDDFSPDGDHGWFADGLTEEILNSLARITDLRVASRTSSFSYRGSEHDIPAIADELGVAHILEGSVRRAGNRLRITAQLIRASDDAHLWSENFDGDIENSIEIQEQIATEIGNALQTAMDPEELARMVAAGTRSVEAWETYLRALAMQGEANETVNSSMAFEIAATFDEAVAIDPSFFDAHLQLVELWFSQLDITTTAHSPFGPGYEERLARFKAAVAGAIKHARSDVDRLWVEYNMATVEVRFHDQIRILEQIAALAPDDFEAWGRLLQHYQRVGELDKARDAGIKAWALRQDDDNQASVIYQMRRIDTAETLQMIDALEAEGTGSTGTYYQAHRALLDAGQLERAREMIDKYELRSIDADGSTIMRVRQACAEGRVSDAGSLYEGHVVRRSNTHWLFLTTLGRHEEANELLRQYDTPEHLFILTGFLDYRTFDPREFPLLWRTMQAQDIYRAPVRQQTFQCSRDA